MLVSGPDSFVGRDEELSVLRDEAERAWAGEPRFVLVSGAAGIGKTRLARQLLAEMPRSVLLRSAGDEAELSTPYGVVDQLLRDQPATSAYAQAGDPLPPAHVVGARLLTVLGDLQDSGPVTIFVDDGQWGDWLSMQALLFTARRLRRDRVLLLVTWRQEHEDKLPQGVDRLVMSEHGARLSLGGLSLAQLGEIVTAVQPQLSAVQVRRLWEHTLGNPLWAKALLDELPLQRLGGGEESLPAPAAVTRWVRQRLNACAEQAKVLVAAAAVSGGSVPLHTLTQLGELSEPFAALDEAVQAELVERSGAPPDITVRFAHPLVAAAAYDVTDTALRSALHRRATRLLPEGSNRLRHEIAASSAPDAALSARVAEIARRQRAHGAVVTAASAFIAAARLAPDRAAHDELTLDAVESFLTAGEVGPAGELLDAGQKWAPGRRLDYLRGWHAFAAGRPKEAARLLLGVWRGGADAMAGDAAMLLAYLKLFAGHGLASASWARRAGRLSTDPWRVKLSTGITAMGLFVAGHPVDALAALDWLPDDAQPPADALDVAAVRANLRQFTDDFSAAREEYHSLLSASRDCGNFLLASEVLGNLAELEYRTGHWSAAADFGERAVSMATDLDQVWSLACVHAVASSVYSRRGEWQAADDHVHRALSAAELLRDSVSIAYAATAAAVLAHSRRDFPAILSAVEPLVRAPSRDGIDEPTIFMWRDLHVEALVRLGRLDEAEATLVPFEELAAARGRTSAQGCAARARGLLEAARGRIELAEDAFAAAVAHHRSVGMPFEQALARHDAGATLRRAGARRRASRELLAASEVYAALGAAPFDDACRRELSACGLEPARRSVHQEPRLTPQETSVARLVTSGLSNREVAGDLVVSVKTVEYHLSNVYSKLGVHSRTQLARRLHESDLLVTQEHVRPSAPWPRDTSPDAEAVLGQQWRVRE